MSAPDLHEQLDTTHQLLAQWSESASSPDPLDSSQDNLIRALDLLTKTLGASMEAREQSGQCLEWWGNLQWVLEGCLGRFEHGTIKQDSVNWTILCSIFRTIRNSTAGSPAAQTACICSGTTLAMMNLIDPVATSSSPEARLTLRILGQALANALMGPTEDQLDLLGQATFKGYIIPLIRSEDDKTLTSALTLLIKALRDESTEEDASRKRLSKILIESENGRLLLRCILQRTEGLFDDETSGNFHLSFQMISLLIDQGILPSLLDLTNHSSRILPERISLLKFLDGKLHQEGTQPSLPLSSILSLTLTTLPVLQDLERILQSYESLDEDEKRSVSFLYTATILYLQCLGHVTQVNQRALWSSTFRDTELLPLLVRLLGTAEFTLERLHKAPSSSQEALQAGDSMAGFAYLKRDLTRLLGNLTCGSREVQDRLRELEALPLLLAQCNVDDRNPYIREYAVLALRHALEGNMANQAIIEELRPVGAAQHPVLEEMGLRTDLDPVTGQPRISRKEMP